VAVISKGAVMLKEVPMVLLTMGRPEGTVAFKEVTLERMLALKVGRLSVCYVKLGK
jgi:hypothetical protein